MPKALVIDDERAITSIISRFLEGADFQVETATSGPEGLEKALTLRPDIIVVDIMMPDMDGYEVCRRLRSDPRTARTCILALTARSQEIDRQMALRSGADAHAAKPFKGKELVSRIGALLADRACPDHPLGYQILILRLKNKVGATSLAANLAISLAQEKGCQAVITDMAQQQNTAGDHLGLASRVSWALTSHINPDDLLHNLARHKSGLFFLSAPSPPPDGQIAPLAVTRLFQMLRNWHDYVIVDTPVNLGLLASPLIRSSALILLLMTPEPGAIRLAHTTQDVLLQSGVNPTQIWPVLNMVRPEQVPIQRQIEQLWNGPVPAVLPWTPEECNQALAVQQPLVLEQPDSTLGTAIKGLAQQIVQTTRPQEKEQHQHD
jgi:twitching motility two-component system response regulator PilH